MDGCKVVFVCGECGAGKSTLVRTFGTMGYPTFHSSAVFSKIKDRMTEGCDMESPEFADNLIHDAMWRFIEWRHDEGTMFVETVPRSVSQLSWIEDVMKVFGDFSVYAVWLNAPVAVRAKRMQERNAGREEFDMKRLESEDRAKHYEILSGLHSMLPRGHVAFIDTSRESADDVFSIVSGLTGSNARDDSVSGMMTSAVNGYDERDGYCIQNAKFDRMLLRVREELDELEASRNGRKGRKDEEEEFADVMHFMFCLADSIGIRPADLYGVFHRKNMINESRLQFPHEDKHSLSGSLVGNIRNDS